MKKFIIFIFSFISIFFLVSCKSNTTTDGTTTKEVETTTKETIPLVAQTVKGKDYYVIKNVIYTDTFSVTQNSDIYLPKGYLSLKEARIVLFLHGGAWVMGSKDTSGYQDYIGYMNDLLMGYSNIIFINMNYRLISLTGSEDISINDQLDDITSCLKTSVDLLEASGIKITRVVIGGHSAGGHLSLLYSYQRGNDAYRKLGFVFSLSGPADMTDEAYSNTLKKIKEGILNNTTYYGTSSQELFSKMSGLAPTSENIDLVINRVVFTATGINSIEEYEKGMASVSPITFASNDAVPTLILQGDKDEIVPYRNSVALKDKLISFGASAKLYTISGGNHMSSTLKENWDSTGFLSAFQDYLLKYCQ